MTSSELDLMDDEAYRSILIAAARKRIYDGYELPPFPVTDSPRDHQNFLVGFRAVLDQRLKDHELTGASEEKVISCSDAVISINLAILRKDREIMSCLHRFILETTSPTYIKWCVEKLRIIYPDTPASSIITLDHIEACSAVYKAVWEWQESEKPLQLVERVVDRLTILALKHLDRLPDILTLIERNITQEDRILIALEDFTSASNPLVEGTL